MTKMLRNTAAENSELLEDWEGWAPLNTSSLAYPQWPELLGTEPAPTTEVLKYKDKQQAKKENQHHKTQAPNSVNKSMNAQGNS